MPCPCAKIEENCTLSYLPAGVNVDLKQRGIRRGIAERVPGLISFPLEERILPQCRQPCTLLTYTRLSFQA